MKEADPFEQGLAAGEAAAFGDALDDGRAFRRVAPAGGVVVEKQERLRPLHHQVVDAHRH